MLTHALVFGLLMGVGSSATPLSGDHRDCHDKKVATPIDRVMLMSVMKEAYEDVFDSEPSQKRLLVGWSQVAFENGGGATIFNNNFGNVGPRVGEECYYNRSDGHFYRSYKTPLDGAVRYWQVVGRCTAAFAAFERGNVRSAMSSLKRCKYFEMDLDTYTHRVKVIYDYITLKLIHEEERERERRQRELEDLELAERAEQSSVGRCD